MAEEGLKALVRRLGPYPEVHAAVWAGAVGMPSQVWVEDNSRGLWLVRVLRSPFSGAVEAAGRLLRRATPAEMAEQKALEQEAERLRIRAQGMAKAAGLPLRIKGGEIDLSRSFLRLYFYATERVDFRKFLKSLEAELKVRVELRQLGPRDEARLLGLVGPCGRPLCCRTFLTRLQLVPLEFAFEQQLFVNPERLTGACGRLKCCLAYERDFYLDRLKGLPEPGQRVELEGRRGKILAHNVFLRTTQIEWSDGTRSEISWDELRRYV